METIQENNEKLEALSRKALGQFRSKCDGWNLTQTSIAKLLGVSRQTLLNWEKGKSTPCMGTALRIKMVLPLLEKAAENEKLPAPSVRNQSELVKEIIG